MRWRRAICVIEILTNPVVMRDVATDILPDKGLKIAAKAFRGRITTSAKSVFRVFKSPPPGDIGYAESFSARLPAELLIGVVSDHHELLSYGVRGPATVMLTIAARPASFPQQARPILRRRPRRITKRTSLLDCRLRPFSASRHRHPKKLLVGAVVRFGRPYKRGWSFRDIATQAR